MTKEELTEKCRAALASPDAKGRVHLLIRGDWPWTNGKKRLTSSAGPFGECLQSYTAADNSRHVLCSFDAETVLAFLRASDVFPPVTSCINPNASRKSGI